MPDSIVLPTAEALAEEAAERFAQAALAAVQARGTFVVALAGGTTPRALYTRLTKHPYDSRLPWGAMHVLWTDERCVPPDDPASNYRMAHEALLSHVPIPADHVHRIRGEAEPVAAARWYEEVLRGLLASKADGRIDLVLLGLGTDGHTASLFPGGEVDGGGRWVTAQYVASLSQWRVTLTPAVINAAAQVLFLVSGPEKASIVRRVLEGPVQLPAQLIGADGGRTLWLLDAAAASQLIGRR